MAPKRTNRNIRMSDEQWSFFMAHMGPEWLRKQIDRKMKKDARERGMTE